jgi:hypothetical protein
MKPFHMITICLFFLVLVTGCNNEENQAISDIQVVLEQAANIEQLAKQQSSIVEYEQKEQKLYEEMKTLGLGEIDKIIELASKAIVYADERTALLKKEKESINNSYAEFKKVQDLTIQLEDEVLKGKVDTLIAEMENRYNAYNSLYDNYLKAIDLDKQFYEMFQLEDLTLEQVQELINEINSEYEQIIKLKDEFNAYTHAYNEAKLAFYQAAELNVVVEGETNETTEQ